MAFFAVAEFAFNAGMIFGPIAAGGVQAGFDADNIKNACNSLDQARKNLQQTKDEISKFTKDFQKLQVDQVGLTEKLRQNFADYSSKLKIYKDLFRQQQNSKDIVFAIFIFCLILTLLFKYFKIIPSIYNVIVGK